MKVDILILISQAKLSPTPKQRKITNKIMISFCMRVGIILYACRNF